MITTHRRFRATSGAVAVLCLLPTVSCGVFDNSNKVTLFGDSLTMLVADSVEKSAASEYEVTVDGTWGLRIDEELDPAAKVAATKPEQVVINLGTNNVLQRHDPVASAEDMSTMLDLLDGVTCIHIVTINEHITVDGQDLSAEAVALNAKFRELAARRLNTDVIDWNRLIDANPGIISDDHVHPNAEGVKVLAKAYLDAMKSC